MVSDKEFYDEFRKSVLGSSFLDNDETSNRISFMLCQFEMIPDRLHKLFSKITRGFLTSPVYAFLGIGTIGTNISRFSVVSSIGSHRSQTERVGSFYKFIGPSPVGKGIAISLISEIGQHIEDIRTKTYDERKFSNEPKLLKYFDI